MNVWSSASIVLPAHIYLLHCVGIYPLETIKEENHASPRNTNSAGSRTCSSTRRAMAIRDLPQVRSAHSAGLPVPRVLLRTDLQTVGVSSPCPCSWQLLNRDAMAFPSVTFWASCPPAPLPLDYVWNPKPSCLWYLQSTSYVVSWCSVEGLPQYLQQRGNRLCTTERILTISEVLQPH